MAKKLRKIAEKYKVLSILTLVVAIAAIYFTYKANSMNVHLEKSINQTHFEIKPVQSSYEDFKMVKFDSLKINKSDSKYVLFFGSSNLAATTFFLNIKNTGNYEARKVYIESVVDFQTTNEELREIINKGAFTVQSKDYLGNLPSGKFVGQDYIMDLSPFFDNQDDKNLGRKFQHWCRDGLIELKVSYRLSYTNHFGESATTAVTSYLYSLAGGHVNIIEENLFELNQKYD